MAAPPAAPRRVDRAKSHVKLTGGQRGESIQKRIITGLRKKGERLQDLFKAMDEDGSNSVDRDEFADALRSLHIEGGMEDYYSLFDVWDDDGSGTLSFTEILAAVSGRRYDAFENFDIDIADRNAKIAAQALKAYNEAGASEARAARASMEAEVERQQEVIIIMPLITFFFSPSFCLLLTCFCPPSHLLLISFSPASALLLSASGCASVGT